VSGEDRRWTLVQVPEALLDHKVSPVGRLAFANQLHQLIYTHYHFFSRYREKSPANVARRDAVGRPIEVE